MAFQLPFKWYDLSFLSSLPKIMVTPEMCLYERSPGEGPTIAEIGLSCLIRAEMKVFTYQGQKTDVVEAVFHRNCEQVKKSKWPVDIDEIIDQLQLFKEVWINSKNCARHYELKVKSIEIKESSISEIERKQKAEKIIRTLGTIHYRHGHYERAREAYQRCIVIWDEIPRAQATQEIRKMGQMAVCKAKTNQLRCLLKQFDISQQPLQQRRDKFEEQVKELLIFCSEQLGRIDTEKVLAKYLKAMVYKRLCRFSDALEEAKAAQKMQNSQQIINLIAEIQAEKNISVQMSKMKIKEQSQLDE